VEYYGRAAPGTAPHDPLVLEYGLDACVGDKIGLDLTELSEGKVKPMGRLVRVGVTRRPGKLIVVLVDHDNPGRGDLSTCALEQGKLIVLNEDFDSWRAILAEGCGLSDTPEFTVFCR
jgi:hypothetical protein